MDFWVSCLVGEDGRQNFLVKRVDMSSLVAVRAPVGGHLGTSWINTTLDGYEVITFEIRRFLDAPEMPNLLPVVGITAPIQADTHQITNRILLWSTREDHSAVNKTAISSGAIGRRQATGVDTDAPPIPESDLSSKL